MQITQVDYQDFRSIKSATLERCGQLNVLIGQNNSGKSNLLKGIVTFFASLRPATLVCIRPSGHDEDIHINEGEAAEFANVSILFKLTTEEQEEVISDLAAEAPQLRNALDDLEPGMLLRVTQSMATSPQVVYVSEISLVAPSGTFEKVLLKVSETSSIDLYDRASFIQSTALDISKIETVRDDYADSDRMNASIEDPSYTRRFLARRFMRNEELRNEIASTIDTATSVVAAQASLTDLLAQKQDALEQRRLTPLTEPVETFAGQSNIVPGYVEKILSKVASNKVTYLDENRKPVGEAEARRLLSLKMRRGGGSELKSIQTTVSSLLGVQIDAFESVQATTPTRPGPYSTRPQPSSAAEMDVDNFLVQVNGSGIREALRLMLDVQFEGPQVLLLEEPEVHLHPALEYNLLQYLKTQSTERQVFLTTHSTNFLDTAEDSNVYLVQKKKNASNVQRLTINELEEEIPRELGIRLSSVFMFDKLVFVEGPSDELVIRELAFRLDINLARQNVGFVQMGGARGFAQYVNAAVIDMLTKRKVSLHFVIDKDERARDELEKMARACGDKASLHVLRKRELENYLLHAHAICSVISKKTQGKVVPDAGDIANIVLESAEALKGRTISRHALQAGCRSLMFDRSSMAEATDLDFVETASAALDRMAAELDEMRSTLNSIKDEVAGHINERWEREKLDLVPGADLLDLVFQKFGVRYRKDRDAAALVRPLEAHEIDQELSALLRRIAL